MYKRINNKVVNSAKWLLAALLLCGAAVAQIDIPIGTIGPIRTFASSVTWAGSGKGAFNNNYIFAPTPGTSGACISLQNNDSSVHGFVIGFLGTANQAVTSYTTNTQPWNSTPQVNFPPNGVLVQPAVFGNGTTAYWVRTTGYARIVLTLSGGSGTGTVSIFGIEGNSSTPCIGQASNIQPSDGSITPVLIQCNSSATVSVPVATTGVLVTSTSSTARVYVCAFTLSVDAVVTTPGSLLFISGTGAACATGAATLWGEFLGTAVGLNQSLGSGTGPLFHSLVDQLCLQNNGATAGSVRVSISYALF